jgi:hypothetical protein
MKTRLYVFLIFQLFITSAQADAYSNTTNIDCSLGSVGCSLFTQVHGNNSGNNGGGWKGLHAKSSANPTGSKIKVESTAALLVDNYNGTNAGSAANTTLSYVINIKSKDPAVEVQGPIKVWVNWEAKITSSRAFSNLQGSTLAFTSINGGHYGYITGVNSAITSGRTCIVLWGPQTEECVNLGTYQLRIETRANAAIKLSSSTNTWDYISAKASHGITIDSGSAYAEYELDVQPADIPAATISDGSGDVDLDLDSDGVPDEQDAFPFISLNGATDTDGDGRPDECDSVCQATGMFADTDDDDDTMPDVYELANGLNPLVDDAMGDLDSDTLTNLQEFDLGTKANNNDTDGDGISDADDAFPLISIGNYADTDNDGAPNECDSDCLALGLAADDDDDNDGIADGDDPFPLNPNTVPSSPVITSIETEDGALLIRFSLNDDGGSSIIDYTVSCGASSVTSAQSPIRISELENDVSYACSVTARNVLGNSLASEIVSATPKEIIRSGLNIPLLKAIIDAKSAAQ